MEQLDPYFAEEATEILQTIEQTLLSLFDEGKTTEKVHTLLRGAHTIKGSAASLNLDTIETIAHHLEDVFQALYAPELEIDSELTNLLLEGYECLRSPLTAMLSHNTYDEEEILDRVASVFAKLQNKLGDFFGREATIPSSEELGFDVVDSIFKDSVPDDLEQLQNAILNSDLEETEQVLIAQANFFLSIAQSYVLPGLEAISRAILAAVESHPERILEIALAALENLQQAREAILEGDREIGGKVSQELQAFADGCSSEISDDFQLEESVIFLPKKIASEKESQESENTQKIIKQYQNFYLPTEEQEPEEENEREIIEESADPSLLSSESPLVQLAEIETITNSSALAALANSSPIERIFNSIWTPNLEGHENFKELAISNPPPLDKKLSNPTIRVAVELLDNLSQSIGELIIEENQNFLQSEQLNNQTQNTMERFFQCQRQIDRIRDWSDKNLRSSRSKKRKRREKLASNNFSENTHSNCSLKEQKSQFDSLEMDTYSDLDLLLQNLTEKVSDLGEEIENIKINIQQSHLQTRKRKQILFAAQENLFEARMVELSTVLNRFPRILEQMVDKHKKTAKLKIIGSEVLIDKAISEKLYEPLLHLIRNAYDHGLESSEIRLQNGKSETGKITIHASHQGNRTTIEVRDDGAGLNWEKISQKALKRNLISQSQLDSITEAELTEILFEPGFSTADLVSDLSGRGVGLDVVRDRLKAIDSSIVARSVPGQGTTFTLQLPLTLTTAPLLVCQCYGITYALVSKAIEQIILPDSEQIQIQKYPDSGDLQSYLIWNQNERLIPIRPFADLFEYLYPVKQRNNNTSLSTFPLTGKNNLNPLLILNRDDRIFCLQVDRVLFEQEIVIKSLASKIDLPSYIQGYSVLGDGKLTLVIDPIELIAKNWDKKKAISVPSLLPGQTFKTLETSLKESKLLPGSKDDFDEIKANLDPENITILAIEDSVVQRRTLVKNLENIGYRVLQASNGKEGVIKLEQNPEIKLIVCDIEMPVMNGFQFLEYCRQYPDFAKIPVIMLTTRSGEKHRKLAFDLGAKAYQTKPSSPQTLLQAIANLTN